MEKKRFELDAKSRVKLIGFAFIAFVVMMRILLVNTGILSADTDLELGALDGVMDIVITIIGKAAFYIGIVITLWGVFQIVLAFRREDSEGISKQITTVVVGAVLVGFGSIASALYEALSGGAE